MKARQKKLLKNFKLYAITALVKEDPRVLQKITKALKGGVDIVQLRSKTLSDGALIRLGKKIRRIAAKHKKLFIVNDRLEVALAVNADGVHLGQRDLPLGEARRILRQRKKSLILGKSTHSLKQALQAQREKADYIGVGPIFKTPTKPGRKAVGLRLIDQVKGRIHIPWVAIGGINDHNAFLVAGRGAKRIAVVRALFNSRKPEAAAKKLRSILE